MNFTVIEAEQLREMFELNRRGELIWLLPPKQHPRMLGRVAGCPRQTHNGKTYWHVQINGRKYLRSHIVFCMAYGRWPIDQIDHIDGDSLRDVPENLREATATQNAWNHKKRAKKSPLPMGVRKAVSGRYVARIAVNKRKITLGTFDEPDQAARAYQAARAQYFGEFA